MLSKKLSKKIRAASDEMSVYGLFGYLNELDLNGTICLSNRQADWDTAIGFAEHLVARMKESLQNQEWFPYEIKALNALEGIPCTEECPIEINAYGFPVEITNNDRLLKLLGITDKLAA